MAHTSNFLAGNHKSGQKCCGTKHCGGQPGLLVSALVQDGVAAGGGVMRRRLLSIVPLVLASSHVEAGCIDPAALDHSTAMIVRHFADEEQEKRQDVVGITATGWFLSPTSLITVEHVAAAMNLSDQNWKHIEIRIGENALSIPVRIQHIAGSNAEKIVALELQTGFSGVQGLQLRMEPLVPEEPLVSLAYPGGHLRFAGGRFVQYGAGDTMEGAALLEMYDGNDRMVLDHGASGAPVFDCTGQVVAVVSNLLTTTMQFMSRTIRISTAWGNPNVVSVPSPVLKAFSRAPR